MGNTTIHKNHLVLAGEVAGEPEISRDLNTKEIVILILGNNYEYRNTQTLEVMHITDWFRVIFSGNEKLIKRAKQIKAGHLIEVQGKIKNSSWGIANLEYQGVDITPFSFKFLDPNSSNVINFKGGQDG